MRRIIAVTAAVTALAAASLAPARAAVDTVAAAPPGAQFTQYATPLVLYQKGGKLTFFNTDPIRHDFVAVKAGPGNQTWCVLYTSTTCPIFWTPLFAVTANPAGVEVKGLENVAVGKTYDFVCTIHANMKGTLQVIE